MADVCRPRELDSLHDERSRVFGHAKGFRFRFQSGWPCKSCRYAVIVIVIVIGGTSLLCKTGNVGEMHSNALVRLSPSGEFAQEDFNHRWFESRTDGREFSPPSLAHGSTIVHVMLFSLLGSRRLLGSLTRGYGYLYAPWDGASRELYFHLSEEDEKLGPQDGKKSDTHEG